MYVVFFQTVSRSCIAYFVAVTANRIGTERTSYQGLGFLTVLGFELLMTFLLSAYTAPIRRFEIYRGFQVSTKPDLSPVTDQPILPIIQYFWSQKRKLNVMDSVAALLSHGILGADGIIGPNFSYSQGHKAICVTGIIAVPAIATNVEILYPGPANNYELTEFISNFVRRDTDTFATSIGEPRQISDTFSIYSKLCVPADTKNASRPTRVQFLSHGGTLDHTYWDFCTWIQLRGCSG